MCLPCYQCYVFLRLTSTRLRHLAATVVSALLPKDDQHDLAKLMLHSPSMQQATYNDLVQTFKNIRMSKLLYKFLTEVPITEQDLKKAEYGISLLLTSTFLSSITSLDVCFYFKNVFLPDHKS